MQAFILFASFQQFYVGVRKNFLVHRQQRTVMDTSRSHNDLIGWITVKLTWKPC